jgi:Asp-tRNA(Asn)/Glu-tRNA(Gln) amidotransferase A subunit family amidase
MDGLMEASIAELQARMTRGEITSLDLVRAYLARIEAYDQKGPALNSVSTINPDALAIAAALDAERAERGPRGPLHGIPVIVKDNYETTEMETSAGSKTLQGWIPPHDAFLVTRLREAGAVILAKATMHEFAYGITNIGSRFGFTRNPYQLDRVPGGSSGGTGAAVAANFAAAGMGSDTCGSIRIPAALNNLVGLRATQGLLSRTGIIPLSSTQDIGGPLARSVEDLALMFDALVGYDPKDPQTAWSVGRVPESYADSLSAASLAGARFGLVTELVSDEPEGRVIARVVERAISELTAAGAEVVEVTVPSMKELISDRTGGYLVLTGDVKPDLDRYLSRHPTAPVRSFDEILASGQVHPKVAEEMAEALTVSADTKEYLEHLARREKLVTAVLKTLVDHSLDALVYPTMRHQTVRIGEEQSGDNCHLSANSGLPAISVAAGLGDDGVPVGIEFLGRPWTESLLLGLAYAYEQSTDHRRAPASTPAL